MTLLEVHTAWAWLAVIGNGLTGVWALAAHRVARLAGRALWWSTSVAWGTMFVQVVLGVLLVTVQEVEVPEFHMFYGFVAILSVGIIYSYQSQVAPRCLLYGLGSLFVMGLGVRAMLLG